MPVGSFLLGCLLVVLTTGPLALAAVEARRRLLPSFAGAPARVSEVVLTIGALTVVAQALGIAGVFEGVWLVLACALAGSAATLLLRRHPPPDRVLSAAPAPSRVLTAVALAGAGLVVAHWLVGSIESLQHGMFWSVDTLWGHGPIAARFAQEGSITGVHFMDRDPLVAFYPDGGELLHSIGIVLVGDDVLSPLVNFSWLLLAFGAAWSIGRPFGAGPAVLLGVAIVLGTPTLIETQPGGTLVDAPGIALFLSAVAILVNSDRELPAIGLAGMAAGLALAMKFSMVIPIGVLTIGVVVVAGRRGRAAVLWAGALTAMAGVWYLRNIVVVGNPLPPLDVDLGPLTLPSVDVALYQGAPIDHLFNWKIVEGIYAPGLATAFGRTWWVVLVLAIVGCVLAVRSKLPVLRMLGIVAAVAIVGFMVAPQAIGLPGFPFFFRVNLRYVTPQLALALAVVPLTPLFAGVRQRVLVALLAVTLLVMQFDGQLWSVADEYAVLAAAVVPVMVLAIAWLAWYRRPTRRVALGAVGVAVALVVGGVTWVQLGYREDRYESLGERSITELDDFVHWARDVSNARIATVGFHLQYPLYGSDLSNYVQYVGERGPNGAFSQFTSCRGWRRALNDGAYDYVVVAPFVFPAKDVARDAPPELAWTRVDFSAASEIVTAGGTAAVFRIKRPFDLESCPEPANELRGA